MSDLGPVDFLRRVAGACRAGRPLDAADAMELAARIDAYEARAPEGVTLDDAFGVATPPGGRPWWASERRARRDEALRQAAMILRPVGSTAERATALSREIRRYQASAWRWEQKRDMPSRYRGGPREFIFVALRAGLGRIPTGRQLRAILAGENLAEVIANDPCESLLLTLDEAADDRSEASG